MGHARSLLLNFTCLELLMLATKKNIMRDKLLFFKEKSGNSAIHVSLNNLNKISPYYISTRKARSTTDWPLCPLKCAHSVLE